MPNVTIVSASLCAGGGHRTINTDAGTFMVSEEDLINARNESFEELKGATLDILRHQYLTRRAAGRTHNQALSDLLGFVVRL
jgi:hypothetical protein